MQYLKLKDGAKILYHLHENYLNRLGFKETFVPLELTKKQKEKFCQYTITKEEKWAYANGIIEISDDTDLMRQREEFFLKEQFLDRAVGPLVKIFTPRGKCYTVEMFMLNDLFLDNDLSEITHWLAEEGNITRKEAKMVVSKVIAFLEK